jgi:hypothetical protein
LALGQIKSGRIRLRYEGRAEGKLGEVMVQTRATAALFGCLVHSEGMHTMGGGAGQRGCTLLRRGEAGGGASLAAAVVLGDVVTALPLAVVEREALLQQIPLEAQGVRLHGNQCA